jgi:hypothetical protein
MPFPALLDLRVSWLPDWTISLALLVSLVLLAWWLHALLFGALNRAVAERACSADRWSPAPKAWRGLPPSCWPLRWR